MIKIEIVHMSDGFLDCKSRTQGSNICQIYFLTSAKIDSHLGNHFTIREWIQGFSFASILILTKFQGEGNSMRKAFIAIIRFKQFYNGA